MFSGKKISAQVKSEKNIPPKLKSIFIKNELYI